MNVYAIYGGSKSYEVIPEPTGEPFLIITYYKLYFPYGINVAYAGDAGRGPTEDGSPVKMQFACSVTEKRTEPLLLGEFFVQDIRDWIYRKELIATLDTMSS